MSSRSAAWAHCNLRCCVGTTTTSRRIWRANSARSAAASANAVLPAPGVATARKSGRSLSSNCSSATRCHSRNRKPTSDDGVLRLPGNVLGCDRLTSSGWAPHQGDPGTCKVRGPNGGSVDYPQAADDVHDIDESEPARAACEFSVERRRAHRPGRAKRRAAATARSRATKARRRRGCRPRPARTTPAGIRRAARSSSKLFHAQNYAAEAGGFLPALRISHPRSPEVREPHIPYSPRRAYSPIACDVMVRVMDVPADKRAKEALASASAAVRKLALATSSCSSAASSCGGLPLKICERR